MKSLFLKLWVKAFCSSSLAWLFISTAQAQTFTNTTVGDIDNSTLCPGATGSGTTADLVRTFNVSGLGTVTDLNVGFIATHTWRGDIRMTLTSPGGTVGPVEILFPDTANSGNDDDYNIELDDEAPVEANSGIHDVANDTTEPPYQFWVTSNRPTSPASVLSAFDGIDPNGTWTMRLCDDYSGESGEFLQAELIFQASSGADLSLTMTTPDTFPEVGVTIPLDIELRNNGPQNANVTVQVSLPPDMDYDSHSGAGTYDSMSGVWTLPTNLASGASQILTVNVIPNSVISYSPSAEIFSSNRTDPDSTPNNSSTSEDDDASLTIFVQPSPTSPDLNCPAVDQVAHVWDAPGGTNGWSSGQLTNSYTAGAIPLSFTLSGDTARLDQVNGVDSPVTQNTFTGGTASEYSVAIGADYTSQSESLTMEIELGTLGEGVEGVKFQIFDVDIGGFIDRITVTGEMNGVAAPAPVLTPTANNYIDGNQAIGQNGNAGPTAGSGNVTVTFLNPVDKITWTYDNHPDVGADPAYQLVSLHTITMCPRRLADITAEKLVEAYDPGATGDVYMTPGSEVLYKIRVTNSAAAEASADDIDITDTLPPNLRFVEASTTGFVGGSFGGPALPAVNQDCGDTPCVIRFTGGSVPINTVAEVIVRATIK
jgi:uncharacterized repeat protein (TIGR01451 family)